MARLPNSWTDGFRTGTFEDGGGAQEEGEGRHGLSMWRGDPLLGVRVVSPVPGELQAGPAGAGRRGELDEDGGRRGGLDPR